MRKYTYGLLLLAFLCGCLSSQAQRRPRTDVIPPTEMPQQQPNVQYDRQGRVIPNNKQPGQDSLQHRDNKNDSITIFFRNFDSTRIRFLDSSLHDFTTRFPVPSQYVMLGNLGSAAKSIIFQPLMKPGFDVGFHAYDLYRLTIENTRFYQTTRPFTEIGYLLGSKAEQTVDIVHTQNIKPNFNMAFQYRLINSPGNLQNQNTNHNNIRLNGNYQGPNKRYSSYGIYISNKLTASENGGIQNHSYLKEPNTYTNRFLIPVRLAGVINPQRNPFNTLIVTGNIYTEKLFLYRHQYDFGQKDSIVVNDSTVIKLFYPRFRLQHTFITRSQQFEFRDNSDNGAKIDNYKAFFNVDLLSNDHYYHRDKWSQIQNDFSVISFPEKKNQNQFIKAGATIENIRATFQDTDKHTYHNIFLNGEYRNRTRNQKWDLEALGHLYVNGINSGDYSAQADLKRLLSKRLGYLAVGFENVNRSPSYIYQGLTAFPVKFIGDLKKENITRIGGSLQNDARHTTLSAEYYVVSNYTYFDSFFTARQEGTLFNVMHFSGQNKIRLTKHWNLYSDIHFQKTVGNPPLQLPLFFVNEKFVYEGNFGYQNLNVAMGFEVKYNTPYKPDNYSPFVGQFFYQDSYTVNNRPDINAFFHFRIKTFKGFIRFENLNTAGKATGKVAIGNNNNLATVYYPQPGLWIRTGIWWTFIN